MRKVISLMMVLGVLFLVSCGSGGSGSSGSGSSGVVTGQSLTLSSSLANGELLAKQGQATIYADVTDADGLPVADGFLVSFSASAGTITSEASTVAGRATATYVATNQGGNVTITAQDLVRDFDLVDEYIFAVASGPAVQIVTESVTPQQLGLRGSGSNEVGTFVFKVTDGTGGPVQDGQVVNFTLESPTGGAEFISDPYASTVNGEVTISLISGSVAGVATVTASTDSEVGTIVTEARITMGNSQPDQLHLGFAAERLNIPGLIYNNLQDTITATVGDRYSNPVPAGTPVYFAGECGIVALTDIAGVATNTTNQFGQATATTITGDPRDELCRYIYWTEGQEAYTDSNGNGMYDAGEPHTDQGEPYIDANDNDLYDSGETYFDLDGNGSYTDVDGAWQGNTFVWTSMNIRWSSNVADPVVNPDTFSLEPGSTQSFTFTAADINGDGVGNPLPSGTNIKVTTDCDKVTLSGDTDFTLPDAVSNRVNYAVIASAATDSKVGSCSLTFEVTGSDEDGNGSGSTTINGEVVVSSGGDSGGDSSDQTFTGVGSGVSEKFTISEPGNYLFDMSYSSSDNFDAANFDLKTESGQIEDFLQYVNAGDQESSDVYLEAGIYYISVSATGSGTWTVGRSKF